MYSECQSLFSFVQVFSLSLVCLYLAEGTFWSTDVLNFNIVKSHQLFTFGVSGSCLTNMSLPQDHKKIHFKIFIC